MEEIHDPGKLMDQIIENIPADYTVKQKILEQVDLESRFEALAEVLATEVEVARIRTDLTEKCGNVWIKTKKITFCGNS